MNAKRLTSKHIIVKFIRIRDREYCKLLERKKKQVICKGSKTRIELNFSTAVLKSGRQWRNGFKLFKENYFQVINLDPA